VLNGYHSEFVLTIKERMPIKDTKSIRKIDDFGHQVVIGAYEPNLEETFPTKTHFGLVQDATYLYGSFRDADGPLNRM
jgi:hypothetical protein